MGRKLTPPWRHLTRRRVPAYLANLRSHTQVAGDGSWHWIDVCFDVEFMSNSRRDGEAQHRGYAVPATFVMLRDAAHSLNISRAMRESSK